MAIALLASCASAQPTPAEPVTIKLAVSHSDQTEFCLFLEDFRESHPHITVQFVDPHSGPDVFQSAPPWVSASSGVFNTQGRPIVLRREARVFTLNAEGTPVPSEVVLPLDLQPLIEGDRSLDVSDFYPAAVEAAIIEGQTLLLPTGLDPLVLYYNQDLFDQSGIPCPQPRWTWEDFLDRALALTDPSAGVYGYVRLGGIVTHPAGIHVDRAYDAIAFVYQNGGRLADDSGQPTLDDPLTVGAIEWYAELARSHGVVPTQEQASDAFRCYDYETAEGCAEKGIRQGQVGMWIGWFSDRGGPSRGMAVLPRGAQPATIARVHGFSISPEAEQLEAGWQLVSFLSRQLCWRLIPARRSLVESSAYEAQLGVGPDAASVARESMENAVVLSRNEADLLTLLTQAIDQVISGSATAEEALTDAQLQAEADLGRTQ